MLSERAAPSATQAGARERAWTSDTFSSWQIRARRAHVEQHGERVLGRRRKGDPDAALGLQLADEPPALGRDQRAGAGMDQALGDVDGGALRAARLEFGDDLKDRPARQRMDMEDGKAVPPPGRAEKLTDVRAFSKESSKNRL